MSVPILLEVFFKHFVRSALTPGMTLAHRSSFLFWIRLTYLSHLSYSIDLGVLSCLCFVCALYVCCVCIVCVCVLGAWVRGWKGGESELFALPVPYSFGLRLDLFSGHLPLRW